MAKNGISKEELQVVIDSMRLQKEARAARKAECQALAESLAWDHDWLAENCHGDGFERHPLLAAPGSYVRERSVTISGEIRDGRGHHPMATFCWQPRE